MVGLTSEACRHILEFIDSRPDVVRFFKNVYLPDESFFHKRSKGSLPPLWDGQASRRIVDVVQALAVLHPATLNGLQ